ncbi:hypothetical protein UlMin_007578 [Ulmus minor]
MGSNNNSCSSMDEEVEVPLPGFRFHPTDEELIGFYLRRKVDKKSISLELIKHIDIYKYDPWDLPKASSTCGDKEWYFFCKRGRKYKNSVRPNRVTGSGFWKATGIDKPVHSHGGGEGNNRCIGLKKTLVYYRGSAGKGTKTDWMMHEFRLPNHVIDTTTTNAKISTSDLQEAEIWTLCRIFKRNISHRNYTPDWRELSTKRQQITDTSPKKYSSVDQSNISNLNREANYIDFSAPIVYLDHQERKPVINHLINGNTNYNQLSSMAAQYPHSSMDSLSSFSSYPNEVDDPFFANIANWDELSAVVEFGLDPTLV